MRRLVLVFVTALGLFGAASITATSGAAPVDPSIGKVEVTLELPKDKPHVGEMIMLRMRSFVRAFIVLDEIRQPPFTNFDWQQLGRDKAIQAMVDGFSVAGIERDIAIFPQQAGRLVIEPFVRHTTIVTDDNRRVPMDFASKTVFVDVQNNAGVGAADAWWLPAKSLSLTDEWSVPPDEIRPGALARRTITIEAVGLTADRLPPAPSVSAPGTIAFKGPAQRETIITADGPIARATYQWDIRPVSSSPAELPAIHVPWFDTSERRSRDAAIPSLWVAYVGTLVHPSHEISKTWAQSYLMPTPLLAGAAGFVWMAALVGLMLRSPGGNTRARLRRRLAALRGLRRAARFQDQAGFRAAIVALARADGTQWARVAEARLVRARLDALDRAAYGRQGGVLPPLRPLAADIGRLMAAQDEAQSRAPTDLPALDGPIAPQSAPSRS